jgi:hypothetical protein
MKLQAHVIMNLALGLSIGLGAAACQKTGKTSRQLKEDKTSTEKAEESSPGSPHGPDQFVDPDPCYACGMG